MSMEQLLQEIKKKAREITLQKIQQCKRDVNVLLVYILSDLYALEALIEEYLKALNEIRLKAMEKEK